MSEKLRSAYNEMQRNIQPTEHLVLQTVSDVQERKYRKVVRLCTAALVAVAFMLLMALSLPVLAMTNTGYTLLYSVSSETAQFFRPIKLSDEDLGIRVEVESIRLVDDTIQIYLAFQDLEGNRIDESIELDGNWGVTPSAPRVFKSDISMAAYSETFLGYDTETKTARYPTQVENTSTPAICSRSTSGDSLPDIPKTALNNCR